MNEHGLRLAVKALGGNETSEGTLVVWKKGCVDPVKYIMIYKEDGGPEDLERLRRLVRLRTPRDVYLVVKGSKVLCEYGELGVDELKDEYLKALLTLAEKLS